MSLTGFLATSDLLQDFIYYNTRVVTISAIAMILHDCHEQALLAAALQAIKIP